MYSFFMSMGYVSAVLYTLIYAKKFQIKKPKAMLFVSMSYATVYLLTMLLYYWISGSFGGKNMARIFVFFPIVIAFFAKAVNLDIKKGLDFFAPLPLVIFAVTHIGCNWGGCCRTSIAVPWGIYNHVVGENLFPNQILETVIAGLSAALLFYLLHKKKYDMGGKAMGYMLMMYGTQRFLLEFIRDNAKLFWGISELALWSLAAIFVGIILNFIILRGGKKHEKTF